MKAWCISALLLIGARSWVGAQSWEIFDINTAGLPSNTVRALAATPDGEAWVGTEMGLAHFDGTDWEVFQTGNSDLLDNDIRALNIDDQGRVWVGSLGGLNVIDNGQWTSFTMQDSDLPENYVRAITPSPMGGVWIGTVGGLAWFDGSSVWHVYTDQPDSYNGLQLPGMNIASIAVRGDGLVCVGTLNAGFTYVTDTSVTVYTTFQNGLPDNTAMGVAVDAVGDRWLACPAGGMLLHSGAFHNGVWLQFSTLNSFIPSNALNCIVIDASDRKIIGTQGQGLSIHTFPNTFQNYNTLNSDLPGDEVFCLALGAPGVVWVGTSSGGVARMQYASGVEEQVRGGRFKLHPVPCEDQITVEALEGGRFSCVVLDVNGRTVALGPAANGTTRLDLRHLVAGSYFLHLTDGAGRLSVRPFTKLP